MHISDTHYDPHYVEGSNADCNEPLCCRITNGRPLTPNSAAGKWGDYRKCDSPKRTVDHMLDHIADTHTVSPYPYIYFASIFCVPTCLEKGVFRTLIIFFGQVIYLRTMYGIKQKKII